MKLLIVAATAPEINLLIKHFDLPDADFIETADFDVLITGVGMTATAFALGRHLNPKYDLVLNLGIAGSFDLSLALGSLVNVVSDTFSELGAEDHDRFLPIETLGFGKSSYHSTGGPATAILDELPRVKGITVNKVHGNADSIRQAVTSFQPVAESMEGAAVFYAAAQLQIPAIQIRSISNYVEPRNREKWQIGPAIASLNRWAIRFLTNA